MLNVSSEHSFKSAKAPWMHAFLLKAVCIQKFMTWYLFLEISENKNTEYLIPTHYLNNDYANVIKFTMVSSYSAQCKNIRKTKNPVSQKNR